MSLLSRITLALALASASLLFAISSSVARTTPPYHQFESAEFVFSASDAPPRSGWKMRQLPQRALGAEAVAVENGEMVVWVRLQFSADGIGSQPLAIYLEGTEQRVIVFLNGTDIHRNYAGKDDHVIAWNRPLLVPIPQATLKPDLNEILLRVDTRTGWDIAVDKIAVGPADVLSALHSRQMLKRATGAQIANQLMLAFTCLAFLLWIGRDRRESDLGWLIVLGLVGYARGTLFYFERTPFDPRLYWTLVEFCLYFILPIANAFCGEFLKVPNRVPLRRMLFGLAVILCISRLVCVSLGLNAHGLGAISIAAAVVSLIPVIRARWDGSQFTRRLMIGVMASGILFGIHDFGRFNLVEWWDGLGFYLQPYHAVLVFFVFFYSVGRRFIGAIDSMEAMNVNLEYRVREATAALAKSEAARHQLEIEHALEAERERLMREVHDGIGSNLVTALAVAQKEQQPEATIRLLRRAVTDLKITVDSLDPMQGDVLALLGNLRHRLEPDLARAGIATQWAVEPCPSLPWLDPASALQFLRLVQEAVSNAIVHSGAREIGFECTPATRNGNAGILMAISDDGCGFDQSGTADLPGKGLSNMHMRAETLGAQLSFDQPPDGGTRVSLWLPIERKMGGSIVDGDLYDAQL